MVAALVSLQVEPSILQPDIVGILVAWWGRETDGSCFCVYPLLYWVENEIEWSICAGNDENWWAKTKPEDKKLSKEADDDSWYSFRLLLWWIKQLEVYHTHTKNVILFSAGSRYSTPRQKTHNDAGAVTENPLALFSVQHGNFGWQDFGWEVHYSQCGTVLLFE